MAGVPPATAQESTPDMDEWVKPPLGPAPGATAQGPGVDVPVGTSPVREPQTPLRVRNLFGQGTPSPEGIAQGQASAPAPEGDVGKAVLLLAAVQKQLLLQQQDKKPFTKNLSSVKLPEFKGGRNVTTKEYRVWRKLATAHMQLHKLEPSEMALLVYLSVTGEARETLELLEVADLMKPDGLQLVWRLLDQAHEQMDHERMEEAYKNWESAH